MCVCVCVDSDKAGKANRSRTPGHGEAPQVTRARLLPFCWFPRWHDPSECDRPAVVVVVLDLDGSWRPIDRCTAKTGCRKEESTEPSLHGQEIWSRNCCCCCCEPPVTARACTPGPALSLSGRRQMARGAPRNLAWPGPSNHGRVQ